MDYYELERQTQMAESRREVAHLHLLAEARSRKPRNAVELSAKEGSSILSTREGFFQLMNMFSALGLVVSPGTKSSTNPN